MVNFPRDLLPPRDTKKLDLGCGNHKVLGSVGVDIVAGPGVDLIHDLNTFLYPLKDRGFDEIYLDNVLEHLQHPVRTLEEVHQVCRPKGQIYIRSPHFSSPDVHIDITHLRGLSALSFDYFQPGISAPFQKRVEFIIRQREIQFPTIHERLPIPVFDWLGISWLANRFPLLYERFLAHIFPARQVRFVLEPAEKTSKRKP